MPFTTLIVSEILLDHQFVQSMSCCVVISFSSLRDVFNGNRQASDESVHAENAFEFIEGNLCYYSEYLNSVLGSDLELHAGCAVLVEVNGL